MIRHRGTVRLVPLLDPEAHAAIEGEALAHPRWADVQNRYGLLLLGDGRPEEAAACFRRSLEVNPRYAWAAVNLACAFAVMDRFSDARVLLADVPDPAPGAVALVEGWVAVLEGRPAVAEAALRRIPQRMQDRSDVLWLRATVADLAGAPEAQALWELVEEDAFTAACREEVALLLRGAPWTEGGVRGGLFPGFGQFWREVSRGQAQRHDFGSAERSSRIAYLFWSDRAAHRNHEGRLAAAQGNLLGAASHYQEALRLDPEDAEAAEALAQHWARRGDADRAVAYMELAVERAPGYPDLHRKLGLLEASRDRLHEALDAYDRALDLNPLFTIARLERAAVLFRLERWEEAARAYRRVADAGLDSGDVLLHLGTCLERLDRPAEAEEAYREAADRSPEDALPHFRLGCLYRRRGRRDAAKASWRRYLELTREPDGARLDLLEGAHRSRTGGTGSEGGTR